MLIWYMIFHHGLISIPPWSRIWSGESQYGFGSVLAFKALCVLLVPRCSGEDQAIASWDFWKLYVHHPSNLYKYGIKGFNPESWDWTLQNSWTYIVCLHLQEKKRESSQQGTTNHQCVSWGLSQAWALCLCFFGIGAAMAVLDTFNIMLVGRLLKARSGAELAKYDAQLPCIRLRDIVGRWFESPISIGSLYMFSFLLP